MSRRDRAENRDKRPVETPPQGSFLSPGFLGVASLAGVAVLLVMNVSLLARTKGLEKKIEGVDGRVAQLARNVTDIAKSAQAPRQQGPDPSKVHTVKTQGSPAKGPENAVVTIAEFSDFQ